VLYYCVPEKNINPTMSRYAEQDKKYLAIALEEAQASYDEGGVPIGAALVSADGKLLGRGHNMRVQKGSATLHVSITRREGKGFIVIYCGWRRSCEEILHYQILFVLQLPLSLAYHAVAWTLRERMLT